MQILRLSIQDFFTKRMLSYALIPFVVTLIVLNLLFFSTTHELLTQFDSNATLAIHQSSQTLDANGIIHNKHAVSEYSGSSFFDYIITSILSSALFAGLLYIVGSLLVFILAIFVALFVIAFLTPYIVRDIQQKHYPERQLDHFSNVLSASVYTVKTIIVSSLLFILFIPLYFIPIVQFFCFQLCLLLYVS